MRVGIVRSDVGHMFINDVESRSQRCFSSQPAGQTRYLHKPTDAEFATFLSTWGVLTLAGTDANATVNTVGANILRVRASSSLSYVSITVTSGATTSKTQIASDLNVGFTNNSLPFVASVDSSNHLHIDTKGANVGVNAHLILDATASSTLNTPVGFPNGTTLNGMSVATLKTAVYPTATTIDVSTATVAALSTFSAQTSTQQAATVSAVADFVAPHLYETGPVLLSFAYGNLSKMRLATFHPGGVKSSSSTFIGLTAGIAAAVVQDDGVTPYTL